MSKKELDKVSKDIYKRLMKSPVWKAYKQGFDDGLLKAYQKMLDGYERGELQFSVETLEWIKKELEGKKAIKGAVL